MNKAGGDSAAFERCPKCGALHLPHRMCQECGTYNGREVKVVKSVVAK